MSKNPGVDKGPQPLMFHPALTTSASERMKTQRFSYFAGFAARERMREAKPVKARKSGVQPLFRHAEGTAFFHAVPCFFCTGAAFCDKINAASKLERKAVVE